MSERSAHPDRARLRALALAGCARPAPAAPVTLRFWAMGREGEVVRSWLRDFEREHPGIHVEVQQIPWGAAHEKLLTALRRPLHARRRASSATPGSPSSRRSRAIEPLDAPRRRLGRPCRESAYFDGHLGHQRRGRRASTASRGTSTRACCSTARTCSPAPATTAMPGDWADWRARDGRRWSSSSGPGHTAILLPDQRIHAVDHARAPGRLAAGRRRRDAGAVPRPEFQRALTFYARPVQGRPRTGGHGHGDREPSTRSSSAARSRCTSPGRGTSASSSTGLARRCSRRGPPRRCPARTAPASGVSMAGGSSLVLFRASRTRPRPGSSSSS